MCNIFTAATATEEKDIDFTQSDGSLRIVVAAVAFGMGLDVPNIRRVIHWGPARNIESYVQESGRSGRDGLEAIADLYFASTDFSGFFSASDDMKKYCNNTNQCRRQLFMEHFDTFGNVIKPIKVHNCCGICAQNCECEDCIFKAALITNSKIRH